MLTTEIDLYGTDIVLSQKAYLDKIEISNIMKAATKEERSRDMSSEEISTLRSKAGNLAWVSTRTSPLLTYQAIVSFQRNKIRNYYVILETEDAREDNHGTLRYVQGGDDGR